MIKGLRGSIVPSVTNEFQCTIRVFLHQLYLTAVRMIVVASRSSVNETGGLHASSDVVCNPEFLYSH